MIDKSYCGECRNNSCVRDHSDKKRACWGLSFKYLSTLFLNDSIELLLTTSEGSLFQTFTMRLKKKYLASCD